MVEIRRLQGDEHVRALAEILADCVAAGASVSFMAPFPLASAESFFRGVIASVERGERILLGAFVNGALRGTVQIVTATPPNQPHRGDVAKLLVSPQARGAGVGQALMMAVEEHARTEGKTLLTLDTVTGSVAERLYERTGWVKVGVIPDYAMFPDGRWCDTTVFYKKI